MALKSMFSAAHDGELAGVEVPEQVTVADTPLVLNGLGLRQKLMFDIYVGALYLPEKTTSAHEAIEADVPKRLEMHFIFKSIDRERLVGQYRETMANVPGFAAVGAELEQLYSMMEDVHRGDVVRFDYAPGTGTTITVKGQVKGTIPGVAFMRVLWGNYLGDNPASPRLKSGMLHG